MAKVDILIPTYNRAEELNSNLSLIADQLAKAGILDDVRVLISNNASTDNTSNVLHIAQQNESLHMEVFTQVENIGLERNAIFLLSKSSSDFVMYLGDDDYLPDEYLDFVLQNIEEYKDLTALIPGNSALHSDGTLVLARSGSQPVKLFQGSFFTSLRLSNYGHQLSGLLLRRDALYSKYCSLEEYRNIYPFIAFLAINCLRGSVIYAPRFQVSITIYNSKDWGYDDSGLLTEIFKNYYLVFGRNSFKSFMSCATFCWQQRWRLRISSVSKAFASFQNLIRSPETLYMIKLLLPMIYLAAATDKFFRIAFKVLTAGRLLRRFR